MATTLLPLIAPVCQPLSASSRSERRLGMQGARAMLGSDGCEKAAWRGMCFTNSATFLP
jgi:hypothetical protein